MCNLNRSLFDIGGKKFEELSTKDHSLNNYFYYFVKIHLVEGQDVKWLDFYVLNAVRDNWFYFFQTEMSLSLNRR